MTNIRRGQKGFTLLEIIVVLAVIGALAAMLAPVVFRYIDDAKKAQAQADTNTIASAVQQMYKDTGRWPFYKVGTSKLTLTAAADALLLTSNDSCDFAANAAACDSTRPDDSASLWTAALAGKTDSLTKQLIKNTPVYATTGGRAWKGPYLDRIPALDPWARSYLVNIGNADPNAEGSAQKWVVVLSAGPNGILETDPTLLGTANPSPGGDDIIARVK
jgi:prepilin-type N-terminal cleavage/methylation domain-containing protein